MKKLLFLLLASFLVLAACGNVEEKSEDKKETKASDKESKKEDKKKDEEKEKSNEKESDKKDDKSNEDVATKDETTEQAQEQEQVNTQEQQPVQSQEQAPVVEEQQIDPHGGEIPNEGYSEEELKALEGEPTDQEKMEANAKVAKEHGFTGIPNGDVGMLDENMPAEEQEQRAKELDEYARQHGGDDMDPFE